MYAQGCTQQVRRRTESVHWPTCACRRPAAHTLSAEERVRQSRCWRWTRERNLPTGGDWMRASFAPSMGHGALADSRRNERSSSRNPAELAGGRRCTGCRALHQRTPSRAGRGSTGRGSQAETVQGERVAQGKSRQSRWTSLTVRIDGCATCAHPTPTRSS